MLPFSFSLIDSLLLIFLHCYPLYVFGTYASIFLLIVSGKMHSCCKHAPYWGHVPLHPHPWNSKNMVTSTLSVTGRDPFVCKAPPCIGPASITSKSTTKIQHSRLARLLRHQSGLSASISKARRERSDAGCCGIPQRICCGSMVDERHLWQTAQFVQTAIWGIVVKQLWPNCLARPAGRSP
jgi:hypothetical protein